MLHEPYLFSITIWRKFSHMPKDTSFGHELRTRIFYWIADFGSMIKMELPVGKKIKGYGLINEYGEFDFIPEQTGVRAGETKLVKQGDNYSVSTTKKLIVVHIRLDKNNGLELFKAFMSTVNEIFNCFKTYEF